MNTYLKKPFPKESVCIQVKKNKLIDYPMTSNGVDMLCKEFYNNLLNVIGSLNSQRTVYLRKCYTEENMINKWHEY